MRIMSDGVHQVRLAQAHAAIDEQRVVRLGGHLRHRQRHRMRKPVAGAHHEGIKGILGVEQRQRIAGGAGLQRLEPVLELLVAVDLHRQGTSRRGADRLLNLAHVTAGAHLLHHGAYALQQHRIPHQRAGLESRFNPGAVTDAGHLLLQNLAGASPPVSYTHLHRLLIQQFNQIDDPGHPISLRERDVRLIYQRNGSQKIIYIS